MLLDLPEREFFRIGEVSDLTGIKPHVLRYWESEFPMLAPTKSQTNQRLYRRADIEMVLCLKQLLYEEGFTIAGARARLRDGRMDMSGLETPSPPYRTASDPSQVERETLARLIKNVRNELWEIKTDLESQVFAPSKTGQA